MQMLASVAPPLPTLSKNEILCRDSGCCSTSRGSFFWRCESNGQRRAVPYPHIEGCLGQSHASGRRASKTRDELISSFSRRLFVTSHGQIHHCHGVHCSAATVKNTSEGLTEEELARLKAKARDVADDINGANIFLVGMMGSGKSTVGKLLANALLYSFFDSDQVVEQASGARVADIFEENGEDFFRDYESSVLQELALQTRCVVSTGGGAVLRPTNWGYMRQGLTVYLDVPLWVLAKRCVSMGIHSRPLLSASEAVKEESPEAHASSRLGAIFAERRDKYLNADFIVSLQDIAVNVGRPGEEDLIQPFTIAYQVLEEIISKLRKKRRDSLRAKGELWREYNMEI